MTFCNVFILLTPHHAKGFVCLMLVGHLVDKEEEWRLLVLGSPHITTSQLSGGVGVGIAISNLLLKNNSRDD